jgi:tRNA-2-methylthio-N6-dimethylallyladenosine synthase
LAAGLSALRTYFVETWGCQMNVLDSQHLGGLLEARGLQPVDSVEHADVALLNTCAVREKAVQKVLSRLGELRALRLTSGRPAIVGLCGCVAEQEGARALARSSALSFVLGPGRMFRLGDALDAVIAGERVALTGFAETRDYDAHLIARGRGARQSVTAIHGCSQHCTFCIVPYTRGHESSRPLEEIVGEVRALVAGGALEITLLGQTVNAYRCPVSGADFGDLLRATGETPGLWRLQFITSHPKFFAQKILDAISESKRIGRYLHLPFQSGSNPILLRMHRGYTREDYLDLVRRIRDRIPDVCLSTDVIVGFPGETEEDFGLTLDLIEDARFTQLYGFAFSPRPRTPAARYGGRVERAEAAERLQRLFARQSAIQLELNQMLIGRTVEVLVDGPAKRGNGLWQGRGDDNRVVNFPEWEGIVAGTVEAITISGATAHALLGERVRDGAGVPGRSA